MRSDETRKPPVLSLSNRFSGLAADSPAPSSAITAAQTPPDLGSTVDFPALRRDATEIPKEDGRIAACSNPDRASRITAKAPSGSDERLDLPASSRAPASSSRRRILKEAVRFHSSKARTSPPQMDHRPQGEAVAVVTQVPVGSAPAPASPPPLFTPTTVIIGDSIIRKVRFFNAVTHCFPGATVLDILEKLPDLLRSFPLFNFLNSCPLTVFISGPLPSLSRGQGRFSRLLSLSIWLHSASSLNRFVFIDNFNLFWNRTSFYKTDGIHPSPLGSNVLAANIRHSVQTSPAPIMPTPVQTSSSSEQTSVCGSD
uniref:SGNH hydrolase-type esterase domain-containing protein n=1 Tax=Oryzias latipes TaxID=8090 RepID=A0A3P9KUQ3_ORYLA